MSTASASPGRRRILLVDDVELNRVLTEAVLRGAAYEIDSVSDGASALAALEDNTYDLVLMDLDMPGLSGHEATAAIRRREDAAARKSNLKVAAISAQQGTSARLRSSESGMAAHIARPIAPHELLRQIEQVFCQPMPEPETDPWQRDCYEEWVSRLGADRMHRFLASLLQHLRDLIALLAAETDKDELHRRAHDVASTGGMLGFLDVTRCCRALLEAPEADRLVRSELMQSLERAAARLEDHFSHTDQIADAA